MMAGCVELLLPAMADFPADTVDIDGPTRPDDALPGHSCGLVYCALVSLALSSAAAWLKRTKRPKTSD